MPAHPRTLPRLLLTAALLVPSASARAAGGALPVGKGDVVKVDLSRVPSSRELRGTAICSASRITLTGAPEELTCERPFTFDGPVTADPVVLVFQPKDGSAPTRVEFPVARDFRPRTFTAPSAGTVSLGPTSSPRATASATATAPAPAAAPAGQGKASPPPEVLEKARAVAAAACGACQGATYSLRDLILAGAPSSAHEVSFTIEPAPRAP